MNNYYVYVILDKSKLIKTTYGDYSFNFLPIYIGQGIGVRRFKSSYNLRCTFPNNESMILFSGLTKEESIRLEESVIGEIGISPNGPLINSFSSRSEYITKINKDKVSTKEHNFITKRPDPNREYMLDGTHHFLIDNPSYRNNELHPNILYPKILNWLNSLPNEYSIEIGDKDIFGINQKRCIFVNKIRKVIDTFGLSMNISLIRNGRPQDTQFVITRSV